MLFLFYSTSNPSEYWTHLPYYEHSFVESQFHWYLNVSQCGPGSVLWPFNSSLESSAPALRGRPPTDPSTTCSERHECRFLTSRAGSGLSIPILGCRQALPKGDLLPRLQFPELSVTCQSSLLRCGKRKICCIWLLFVAPHSFTESWSIAKLKALSRFH